MQKEIEKKPPFLIALAERLNLRLVLCLIHGISPYCFDVWWNQSRYMSDRKFPKVFDENGKYIHCNVGAEVIMGYTKNGGAILYKVTNVRTTGGSDWLYSSDAYNCDMIFSRIYQTP